MKTQAMNEIDPHCAGELEPSAAEALALENMMAAEAVLNELASVFFASGSAFASSTAEPADHHGRATIPAAELPNAIARYRTLVEQIPAVVFMAFLDKGIGE